MVRASIVYAALSLTLWLGLGWATESHAQAGELLTFHVVAKGGRLSPERIDVPAGKRIKIILRNEGPGPIEFESFNPRIEKVLAPGGTSFVVLPPLKPGTYTFIDEFHPETGAMQLIAK
ncbi:MAG: cupredoxin domain-containing protein [Rhodocyclaceae bacterium]|nr:MAG: cupredoxin domain-containing protein [Rhodocyclaceae bacterium]